MEKGVERLIKQLAVRAGALTAKKFGKVGVKYTKANIADVVTEADLMANKIIVDGIKKRYPGHDIISEELPPAARSSPYVWIIDPLDGTRNFVTRMPLFCTMIGFAKNNVVQLAAIYDPIHKNLYFAQKGRGAFLNGKRIHCSATKAWHQSFGSSTANWSKRVPRVMKRLAAAAEKESFWMSSLGSGGITMTSVASGKRDWACSLGHFVWDYAAPFLILKEAGCAVTDAHGKPWKLGSDGMIAGNPYLQPKILKLVREALE